jgi:ABC-type sugar transport system ATPase subunit
MPIEISNKNPLLEMQKITKYFGENRVLDEIGFNLYSGEVHALLGENGAGKSTLMKILIGVYRADFGKILIDGIDTTDLSVSHRRARGIAMIFQELSLIPNLTVAENLLLGREPLHAGWLINFKSLRLQAQKTLDAYDFPIKAETPVEKLGFAQRQMVEIVKALSSGARILIMDEPTSSLTSNEEEKLFNIIRSLKMKGIGIVYISHRMAEIFKISDRISVICDGRLLPTQKTLDTNDIKISELMSQGDRQDSLAAQFKPKLSDQPFRSRLTVSNLRTSHKLKSGISLEIAKGEVLGVAGLVGSGRSTLAKALFGLIPDAKGIVKVDGNCVKLGSTTNAISAGFGFVPEDRREEGLIIHHSLASNISLPHLKKLQIGGGKLPIIFSKSADEMFNYMRNYLRIICRSGKQQASELSGGNQQKVVFAKWLSANAKILILDEPTSGVDVNAKEEMRMIIRNATASGASVLLISSEIEELSLTADRIVIMIDGQLGRSLPAGFSATEIRTSIQEDVHMIRKEPVL